MNSVATANDHTVAMGVRFADVELDVATRELRRGGEPVAVEPQVFEVLAYLIRHRERVVPKTELLDEIWGDQFVSESALTTRIKQARQAVGDDGKTQRAIRTSHGFGYRFVAELDVAGEGPEAVAGSSAGVGRTRFVPPAQPLIGRGRDMADVLDAMGTARVVTLVGPGGIGKTLLAQHALARLDVDDRSPVTIDLAAVRSTDDVLPAVVGALGLTDVGAAPDADGVAVRLGDQRVLLFFDNAEHVLDAVAPLAARLVTACPHVSVLATSRARLAVPGERVIPLESLPTADGVELFVASAADSGADLDPDDPDLVSLCRRLDGMPLALQLLAARSRFISLTELHADLSSQLAATSAVPADGRHRSVDAALRWPIDELPVDERRALEDLSVFAGSFDRADAAAIIDVPDATAVLMSLCERSLVTASPTADGTRYRLLEPVRLTAIRTHPTLAVTLDRHAEYFVSAVERIAEQLETSAIDEAFATLQGEWSNIRAAVGHLVDTGDLDALSRLVCGLADYADGALDTEVHGWAAMAVRLHDARDVEVPTPLLSAHGRFAVHHNDLALIGSIADELERRDAPVTDPRIAITLIGRTFYEGDRARSESVLRAALGTVAGTAGYSELTLSLLHVMANPQPAEDVLDRLEVIARLGGPIARVFGDAASSTRLVADGDIEGGIELLGDAVRRIDGLGLLGVGQALSTRRASIASRLGGTTGATALIDSIERSARVGALSMLTSDLVNAAEMLAERDPDMASLIVAALTAAGYNVEATIAPSARHERQGRLLSITEVAGLTLRALAETAGSARS